MTDAKKVRIRWGPIRDCGPISKTWPFEGIIVEYLDGRRIQDIPTEHTPAVVHAVVGEPITISHYVKKASTFVLCPTKPEVVREQLTLLVTANEIPEAKREELKREWIRFMTESDGH